MFVLFYRNKIKREIIVEDFTYIIYTMLKIILVCSFEEDFLKFSKSATHIVYRNKNHKKSTSILEILFIETKAIINKLIKML
jgi:hypothetical protein